MANNLIKRAKEWLKPYLDSKEVKWNAADNEFTFNTVNWDGTTGVPAILKFGYADQADSHLRYQGGEFHGVFWDEATHFKPEFYEYLFSRLRKKVCHIHKVKDGKPNYVKGCEWCDQAKSIPLQVRSATNPGARSHQYFKDRFLIERDPDLDQFVGRHPDRPFIPAFVSDNPHIDQEQYIENLKELDPIKREQLLKGDWDASADALYRKEGCRFHRKRGNYILFDGYTYLPKDLRWFFTMDCAATRKELQEGDSTVIGLWGLSSKFHLGLFDCLVLKEELPDIVDRAVELYKQYHRLSPETFLVEKNGVGIGISQSMSHRGLPVRAMHKSVDKVQFAQKGIIKMSQGRIYLPEDNPVWKSEVTGQLFVWQGLKDEPDDIVDMVSMAAHYVDWSLFEATSLETATPKSEVKRSKVVGGMSVLTSIDVEFPNYF